jgi:hypothetical protein
MAKSKSTRLKARKSSAADQPPTPAERRRAIRSLRKDGGAHLARPSNGLIQDTPADTVGRCKSVVDWLAHIEQPFTGGNMAAAEADVLHMVVDALEHAENVIRQVGSLADAEVAHG